MTFYCSKGHENAATNLYCQQCGEKLNPPVGKGIYAGMVLGDRYRIIRELGHGGFGRTYLAEDINRFREPCVLKEFAPQVRGTYALQKASELFEREAGVLYKLQHRQIPRFRELFRTKVDDQGYLLLVQDYVEGKTYRALLDDKKRQGLRFTEAECTILMREILPVLEYIHSLGVVHRDISPDNMILRDADYLPVLIDFGGVKQVAADVESQFTQAAPDPNAHATRLGKIGYAPNEQMQVGLVYPHSDLYALAATILVLLTGKEPQQLIDPHNMTWNWRAEVNLSSGFGAMLDKMLAYRPGDRYQSARELMQVLSNIPVAPNIPPTQPPVIPTPHSPTPTQATLPVSPAQKFPQYNPTNNPVNTPISGNLQPGISADKGIFGKIALVAIPVLIAGSIGWIVGNKILSTGERKPTPNPSISATAKPQTPPPPQFSKEERDRKAALQQQLNQLGVNYSYYSNLVNESFWQINPTLRGKSLSNEPKDEKRRKEWDEIGRLWLNRLNSLSPQYRSLLGSYGRDDLDKWKAQVNKLYLSTRALNDLADAEFFYRFPDQQGKNFINKPIGQIWYAIANSKVDAIQNGTALQRIVFPKGEIGDRVSGNLKPGEGKVYIAGLGANQIMSVNLQADPKILFSVYPTTSDQNPLLADSTKRSWSGTLPRSGFYEFVVVSKGTKPLDYRIELTAENPLPPSPSPLPTALPTESPSPSPTPSPTETPTESPSPTPLPTETPTESPSPSPSPETPIETPPPSETPSPTIPPTDPDPAL